MMDETPDDGALVEASLRDPTRFSELFDRHFAAVHAFCARRVGHDAADDLAGETFCQAFAARQRFDRSRPDARPWLFGIALNLVRMSWRSGARRAAAYERAANRREGAFVVGDDGLLRAVAIDAQRDLDVVVRGLAKLPDDEVDALLLHVWEGLSYEEVADALAIPIGTVRSRISRARARLRALLDASRGAPAPTPTPSNDALREGA